MPLSTTSLWNFTGGPSQFKNKWNVFNFGKMWLFKIIDYKIVYAENMKKTIKNSSEQDCVLNARLIIKKKILISGSNCHDEVEM